MFQGSKCSVQFFLRLHAFSLHPRQARTLLVGGPPRAVFVRGLPGNRERKLVQMTAAPSPLTQLPRVFHRREHFSPPVQRVVDASGLFHKIPVAAAAEGADDEGAQGGNHLDADLLHRLLEVHLEDVLRLVVNFQHLLEKYSNNFLFI